MWRRPAVCSSGSSGAGISGGRARILAVMSSATETLRRARKASRQALQPQPIGKDVQPPAEGVPLASGRLPLPEEDSQILAAILFSRTVAKEEDELRMLMEKQLAEALHDSQTTAFVAGEGADEVTRLMEIQLQEALQASEASAAAAQEELTRLEAQLQDALRASRLSTRAAAGLQGTLSSPCAVAGGCEEELAAALAEVQTTLRATARGPSSGELCQPQEGKDTTEAAGPACFDMAEAGSSQVTLHPTMLAGEDCSPNRMQSLDALDQWWGGLGVDGTTLGFAGGASGKTRVAEDDASAHQNFLGSVGGA